MKSKKSYPLPHEILSDYFRKKKQVRPNYSLRALARDMKLSPSYISEVFSGKRVLQEKHVPDVATFLEMDTDAEFKLLRSVLRTQVTDQAADILETKSQNKSNSIDEFTDVSRKHFALLQHWYTVAVWDLVSCLDFRNDADWIAKRLGITPAQADSAIHHLIAESYVVKDKATGRYTKNEKQLRIPTTTSQPVVRSFHSQLIQKAQEHLKYRAPDEDLSARMINGITIAGNPENFEKARKILNQALHDAALVLMEGSPTEVYQLNCQLFLLTQPPNSKKA